MQEGDGLTKNMLGDPDKAERFIERIPRHRIGTPEDIAASIFSSAATKHLSYTAQPSLWIVV